MADKKEAPKKKAAKKRHEQYDGAKQKNQNCPKCGSGYFLAEHKNRRTCGKCKYVEAKSAPKEEDKK
jgi:ubiquitin-small subunit ribosomal protein S27Ae